MSVGRKKRQVVRWQRYLDRVTLLRASRWFRGRDRTLFRYGKAWRGW